MKYGKVNGVDKPVSRLVLGTDYMNTKELEKNFAILDGVFELGCNTFDTAHVYAGGDGERLLGMWMKERGNRDKVVIITKGAHHNQDRKRVTPYDITSDLHDSLARLKTDYIDIYLLHRDDPEVPVGPIVEVLNEHLKAGKIKAFGGSNWHHTRIQEANEYAKKHGLVPFAASSPHYSLAEQVMDPWGQGCVAISGPKEKEAREWYIKTQLPLFPYSSLARGFFSGRISRSNFETTKHLLDRACLTGYCHEQNFKRLDRVEILAKEKGLKVPQIAMAFIMNQPLNVFPLIGARSPEELMDNIKACDITLTKEELDWLDLLTDKR
ncbi:MAG TPA: aldo/keto reductase [Clostridiaceae bacterium]|nr:aldo/keto reductase [Clostridiaceae bacterium]